MRVGGFDALVAEPRGERNAQVVALVIERRGLGQHIVGLVDKMPALNEGCAAKAAGEEHGGILLRALGIDFVIEQRHGLGNIGRDDRCQREQATRERLGRILEMNAAERIDRDDAAAGDIVACVGFKNSTTGDTLCAEGKEIVLEKIEFAKPVIDVAIEPKTKAEQDKMSLALTKLAEEDPTFQVSTNHETGQTIIAGMGELHLEIIVDRLLREFKVDANVGKPQVAYRETAGHDVEKAEGKFVRQSGGRGQYGHAVIKLEKMEEGFGYEFVNAIVGGVVPKEYIPSIDKGIQEAAARGFLAGCQVVDFRVKVYDGSYHTVDSSEMAFKVAGSLAFKKAIESLKPVLLEPIVLLCVSVPDEYMGDVIGDLSSRRGKVLGSDSAAGVTEIKAHVPMSEVLRYAPDLRSMTAGQGFFTMEFAHYEEAPQPVADKVIAEHQKAVAGE